MRRRCNISANTLLHITMVRAFLFIAAAIVAGLVSGGCSRSTPVAPAPPPVEPAPPPLNLTGAWAGVAGQSGSGASVRLNWTAVQLGAVAAGPGVVTKPVANISVAGTFTAVLSGSQMTLTFVAPRGTVSGFANCIVTGAGSGTATTTTISGSFTLALTSCEGLDLDPLASAPLTLTRQ
jgi:hypothetical protein